MTQDMMTLRTLLEKTSDADLLREMIGFTAERLMALEVWLRHAQFLPEARLSQVMGVLFGARVSPATLAAMSRRAAARLRCAAAHIQDLAASKARVKHLDETGLRVGGRTRWLHAICTPLLAAYRVSERRGAVLPGVTGVAVHDHWQCYWPMEGVEHALCNAHRLRELQALVEFDKEDWAGRMQQFLRRAWRVARLARERDIAVPGRLLARLRAATTGCLSRRWRSMRASRRSRLPGRADAGPRGGARATTSLCACMSARTRPCAS